MNSAILEPPCPVSSARTALLHGCVLCDWVLQRAHNDPAWRLWALRGRRQGERVVSEQVIIQLEGTHTHTHTQTHCADTFNTSSTASVSHMSIPLFFPLQTSLSVYLSSNPSASICRGLSFLFFNSKFDCSVSWAILTYFPIKIIPFPNIIETKHVIYWTNKRVIHPGT